MHKLSIVTISFNSEQYLEQTIRSVIGQSYANIEYVVVDGGSNDGTLDIIRKYDSEIDRWISEPDAGIADAMNKALSLTTGDFVYFLHSDDYLEGDDAIEKASRHLTTQEDIFLFSIYLEKEGARVLRRPRGFSAWINFKTGVYHQSVICSKSLFEKIGPFDTDFRIAMDYDFFLRAYRQGIKTRVIDLPLATMRLIGVSSQNDWPSLRERFADERKLHRKNCHSTGMRLVYAAYWLLYLPYRRLRHLAHG